jgi:hypothetical protein
VLSIVEPLWQDKTETVTRVLNRISLILDWATARKLRTGDNSARWKGHLDAMLPKRSKVQRVVNHAALPYAAAGILRRATPQWRIGAKAAELMILTATRTNEARFAPWTRVRPGWLAMGDPCGADEGGSRPPHSVVGAVLAIPRALPEASERVSSSMGAARDPEGATEGRTRNYLPRLPLYVSRRGCRTDELSERGCRDGARARGRR